MGACENRKFYAHAHRPQAFAQHLRAQAFFPSVMSDTTDAVPAPQAQPLISVLMPAYKHAAFVHTALDSVLQQSWQHLEVIVIDDASPDTTWDVLQACTDPRLRLLRNEHNLGSHGTMNAALQLARGEFIAIINSDDLFLPERLASCYAALQASGADLVGTDMRLMDDDGNVVTTHWWIDAYEALKRVWTDTQDWPATLLAGNVFMTTSNFFFRRRWLEQVGDFQDLRYVLDYDWLLRGLGQGLRLAWIDTPLLQYRLHAANTISERPLRANLLRDWLAAREREWRTGARVDTPAAPAAEPGTRFRLRRWPPMLVLHNDPVRIRIATMLMRQPMGLADIVALSGQGAEICKRFLQVLDDAGVLQSATAAPTPAPGAAAPQTPARGLGGLLGSIRRRLGL